MLPRYCNCSNAELWQSSNLNHWTVPYNDHNITNLTNALIDNITTEDVELYEAGLERFLEEAAAVEKEFGTKILCPSTLLSRGRLGDESLEGRFASRVFRASQVLRLRQDFSRMD